MTSCNDFIDRKFKPLDESHRKTLKYVDYKTLELDDPKYDWEYYGSGLKYGRYAVCKNTGIMRGLTMGEFYGTSTVD